MCTCGSKGRGTGGSVCGLACARKLRHWRAPLSPPVHPLDLGPLCHPFKVEQGLMAFCRARLQLHAEWGSNSVESLLGTFVEALRLRISGCSFLCRGGRRIICLPPVAVRYFFSSPNRNLAGQFKHTHRLARRAARRAESGCCTEFTLGLLSPCQAMAHMRRGG